MYRCGDSFDFVSSCIKLIFHPVMRNLIRGLASKIGTVNKDGLGESYIFLKVYRKGNTSKLIT